MAWLSQATNNEGLVSALVSNGVISITDSPSLHSAFTYTDRGTFIPGDYDDGQVYSDRPFRNSQVHMSAPHMYCAILNALELKGGMSFLNIGSGSGYLSCLASCLLGENGVSHGVELNAELVENSRLATTAWFSDILSRRENGESDLPLVSREGVQFVHGNCFAIDVPSAASAARYDRVYIGASCPKRFVEYFYNLLADDGVMLVPVQENGELLKIHRIVGGVYTTECLSSVYYAPLQCVPRVAINVQVEVANSSNNEQMNNGNFINIATEQGLGAIDEHIEHINMDTETNVDTNGDNANNTNSDESESDDDDDEEEEEEEEVDRNTSHFESSSSPVKLPPILWQPRISRHKQFPPQFRKIVYIVILAQRFPRVYSQGMIRLDFHLWCLIFSFASRDWFQVQPNKITMLTAELNVERSLRLRAENSLRDTQLSMKRMQSESNLLRDMVSRLQRSLRVHQTAMAEQSELNISEYGITHHSSDSINSSSDGSDDEENMNTDTNESQLDPNTFSDLLTATSSSASSGTDIDDDNHNDNDNELHLTDNYENELADHYTLTSSTNVNDGISTATHLTLLGQNTLSVESSTTLVSTDDDNVDIASNNNDNSVASNISNIGTIDPINTMDVQTE